MYDFSFNVIASALGSILALVLAFIAGRYWGKAKTIWNNNWKTWVHKVTSIIVPFGLLVGSFVLFAGMGGGKTEGIKSFKTDGSEWNETDQWRITECKRVSIEFARQQVRNPRRADRRDALSHFKGCVKSHGFGFEECIGADENCQTFVGEMRRRGWL